MTGSEHVAPGFPFLPGVIQSPIQPLPASPRRVFFALYSAPMPARFSLNPLAPLWVLICLHVCVASADTPVPFGLPAQYRGAETVPGFDAVRDASELANVDQAQVRLKEIERRLGPYHPSLAAEFVQVAQLAMDCLLYTSDAADEV